MASFPWDDALGYPTREVSVGKLLGVALVVTYLLSHPLRRRTPLPWPLWAVGAFLVVAAVSLVRSGRIADGATQAMRYVLFAALAVLVVQLVTDRARLTSLVQVFVASSTVAAAVGTFRFLTSMTGRASGPIGEANDFAYVLAAAIPLAVHLAWRRPERRVVWAAASVVLGVTVALTLSRGAIVGLAVAALWAALQSRAIARALVAVALVGGVLGLGLVAVDSSFVDRRLHAKVAVADENWASRKALWRAALDMAAEEPILGVGTGLYPHRAAEFVVDEPYRIVEPVAHNAYLEILAEDGALGLVAFVAFVAGSGVMLVRTGRRARGGGDGEGWALALALQASLVVAVVGAGFLSVQIAPPIWLTCSLAVPVAATVQTRARSGAGP